MRAMKVHFFGDSVCVGQHVSIHKGWVTLMSARLSELGERLGREITVTNSSANGRTTRQALECMPYEVQSHEPDLVVVQFGMNDCNHWKSDRGHPRVSADAFRANLREIAARAFVFGARRVFLNTNHPTALDQEILPFTSLTYQQSNERYNQLIREAAAEEPRATLNDVERAFNEYTRGARERLLELLLPDPDLLHPSARGHQLYMDVVYPAIEAAVRELAASA